MLANSEDPDQTPHYVAPILGLHCSPVSQKKDARLICGNLFSGPLSVSNWRSFI